MYKKCCKWIPCSTFLLSKNQAEQSLQGMGERDKIEPPASVYLSGTGPVTLFIGMNN